MKIKLNQMMAGPNGVVDAGGIIDVDEATAKHLIQTNQGEAVQLKKKNVEVAEEKVETQEVETAEAKPEMETADAPKRRGLRSSK